MILVIDNYDSFVYNLARHFELTGKETCVMRNDAVSVKEIAALSPEAIIISPGPCTPQEAGICIEMIETLGPRIPILGVCLGHQCIGEAFGGKTIRAAKPVHGKSSRIAHKGQDLFSGMPQPFEAGRYHSLIADIEDARDLVATARSEDGEIMALRHKTYPVYGVQFHPESVLTEHGLQLLRNFSAIAQEFHKRRQEAA